MLETLLIFIAALCIRIIPIRNARTDFDTFGHLYVANEVKRQRAAPWGSILLRCWNSDHYSHPYLWHKIIALFPLDFIKNKQQYVNSIIDASFCVVLYIISLAFLNDVYLATLCVLLYLLTPMWYSSLSVGPRISSLTPRLFSELLFTTAVLLIALAQTKAYGFTSLIFPTILLIILLLSSKFGAQAILFLMPGYSIFTGDLSYVVIAFVALVLSFWISGFEMMYMLRRHFRHLYEYHGRIKDDIAWFWRRNSIKDLAAPNMNGRLSLRRTVWNILAVNSYTATLLKLPILVVALAFSIQSAIEEGLYGNHLPSIVIWTTCIFVIVNNKRLLYLGEAERYFNHISGAVLLTAVQYFDTFSSQLVLCGFILYGIGFWLVEVIFVSKAQSNKSRQLSDRAVEDWLLRLPGVRTVMSIPPHNFDLYRVMLNTSHKTFFPLHSNLSSRLWVARNKLYVNGTFDLKKLELVFEKAGVNILIIDKGESSKLDLGELDRRVEWIRIILPQTHYVIYSRSGIE